MILQLMSKRMAIMLAIVGGFFVTLFGYVWWRGEMIQASQRAFTNPPQTVSTIKAIVSDWRPSIQAIGTFRAINGADLSLEHAGIVEKIYFQSGEEAKLGQILLELRKETDHPRLESLKAAAELADQIYKRDLAQLKLHVVSQSTIETDLANLKGARAQVAQQEEFIDQKTLRAPFSGRLGLRHVDLGQHLQAGAPIVTLQELDPIFVDFMIPQRYVSRLSVGQEIKAKVDAFPGAVFSGAIAAINPKVDPLSRNIELRASLKNPDHKLMPGMFARLEINAGKNERLVTLPQAAIVYGSYGNSVFVVLKEGEAGAHQQPPSPTGLFARQSFVQLGETRGDQVAVVKGVPEGAIVVTAGQIKLRNGSPVTIDNRLVPTNDANPEPQEE